MAKNKVTEKNFETDYKVISLICEYPGYVGDVKYAIITDLTEEELYYLYEKEIRRYIPFVILSNEVGRIIREYERNEEKYAKREARGVFVNIACNEEDEALINSLSVDDEHSIREREEDEKEAEKAAEKAAERFKTCCRLAFSKLTPLQCEYLTAHYRDNKSFETIAKETGKRKNTIWNICERGRRDFIAAVEAMGVVA